MNKRTATENDAQRKAEWAIIGSVVIPIVAIFAALFAVLFITGMGGLNSSISSLSNRVSDLSDKVSTQTGVIQTEIPSLKKEHDNIRAELSKDLTAHYRIGHDESGGG